MKTWELYGPIHYYFEHETAVSCLSYALPSGQELHYMLNSKLNGSQNISVLWRGDRSLFLLALCLFSMLTFGRLAEQHGLSTFLIIQPNFQNMRQ